MDTTSRPSFPEPDPDPGIKAVIHGPVHGQVAIGEHIYQNMWHVHGDLIVRATMRPQQPRARTRPIYLLPRVFPGLLDRQSEMSGAVGTLMAGEPVNVHGEEGVGKTSLLRAISHHETAGSFRDGVVWIRAGFRPAMDLLQVLFEMFYEWDVITKPTEGQLRHGLRSIRALVICDDIQLTREDLEMVLDTAPECSFLVSTGARLLWSSGRSVPMSGLPVPEATTLVERELGRTLADEERGGFSAVHTAFGGHPLQLLQVAALVRSGDRDFAGIARDLRGGGSASHFTTPLSDQERRMLAVVSTFAGVPVRSSMAGMIAEIPASEPVLESLLDRHLVIRKQIGVSGEGYASAGGTVTEHIHDLDRVREQALETMTIWAEEHRAEPSLLLQDADAALTMLRWAGEAGQWTLAIRLGRALNGALALGLRWGSWSVLLGTVLQAARSLDSARDIAWARHQMGTRAVCMGNERAARAALTDALRIRLELGDREGAAVTRHNLNMLTPIPARTEPRPREPVHEPTRPVRQRTLHARLPIIAVLLAVMGGGGWFLLSGEDDKDKGTLTGDGVVINTPTSTAIVTEPTATDRAVIIITPTETPQPPVTDGPVQPILITLSLDDQSKAYGDPEPILTYSYSGGDSGLTFTGAPERDPGEGVGTYAIRQGSLAIAQPGYELNVVEGIFTITSRLITVVADTQTKMFDTPDPPLTFSSDTSDVPFAGALVRDPGEEVGSYTIRQGSLAIPDPNYAITFVEGTLTITAPPENDPGGGDVTIPNQDPAVEATQVLAPPNEPDPVE